jgi:hypothetical protein
MKRRGIPIYAPELVGSDSRSLVEREFLKIQEVVDQVAQQLELIMQRLDALEESLSESEETP